MHAQVPQQATGKTGKLTLWRSIGLRLLRYVFGFYLIVTVVVTVIQLVSEYRIAKHDIFKQLKNIETTFRDSFAVSIWNFDTQQLDSTLAGLQKVDVVYGAKVTDHRDEVLSHIGVAPLQQAQVSVIGEIEQFDITEVTYSRGAQSEKIYQYRFPLSYQSDAELPQETIGHAYIYSNDSIIFTQVKYSLLIILASAAIKTLALWFIFFTITQRVIAAPLKTLTRATMALNPQNPDSLDHSQDLEEILKSGHKDELHTLAYSFDTMRQAVVEKIKIIEQQNQALEKRVQERTQHLENTLEELRETKDALVVAAHQAGMAQSATHVLHNVGNILNSVKVSVQLIQGRLEHPVMSRFSKIMTLIRENEDNLSEFISSEKGENLVAYMSQLEDSLQSELNYLREHSGRTSENVDAIAVSISEQGSYASKGDDAESVALPQFIEHTLVAEQKALEKLGIRLELRPIDDLPQVRLVRAKAIQILQCVIKNAREALAETESEDKIIKIWFERSDGTVSVNIQDNGAGIATADLEKIFANGYTTKSSSHGFGLHSSANFMTEMGGKILAHSDGVGTGATFSLQFRISKAEASTKPAPSDDPQVMSV